MPRRRRKIGRGFSDFMNKAKGFLQRTKLLSRMGTALSPLVPAQYQPLASMGLNYAKSQGYGRRRRGGALYPVGARRMRRGGCCGGSLVPAGGARMSRKIVRPRLPPRMPVAY